MIRYWVVVRLGRFDLTVEATCATIAYRNRTASGGPYVIPRERVRLRLRWMAAVGWVRWEVVVR